MRPTLVLLSACLAITAPAASFPKLIEEGQTALRGGKAAEAIAKFKDAVAKNPVHGDGWYSLGTAAYQAKQYDLGAEAYLKAAALGANPKDAFYDRACCLALSGKRPEAIEALVKSLELGFRDIWHVRTDEDVKPLLNDPKLKAMLYLEDVSKMNREEGYRFDLKVLYSELKRLHYSPFHKNSESKMDDFVKSVGSEIPKLNDDQIVGKFMQLAVMFGDAHTALRPGMAPNPAAGPATYKPKFWPIQVYGFEEGYFVTAAAPEYADLAGTRLLEMNGKPVEACLKLLDPVISRDNDMWPKLIGPNLLGVARATFGVGITGSAEETTIKVQKGTEIPWEAKIRSLDSGVQPTWKLARDPAKPPINLKKPDVHWYEEIPDKKAFYVAFQAVQNQPNRTVAKFLDEAFGALDKSGAEVLVLDMRRNGGGNNFLNKPLLQAVLARPKINQRGKFFVIIGRNTFSAAVCGVGNLNRLTEAMFVGEPTGSPPNFIGETIPVTLPYSRLVATVSDLYWQNTVAMDERVWIAPDLYAPPSFKMLLEGRDPATEAIWEFLAEV